MRRLSEGYLISPPGPNADLFRGNRDSLTNISERALSMRSCRRLPAWPGLSPTSSTSFVQCKANDTTSGSATQHNGAVSSQPAVPEPLYARDTIGAAAMTWTCSCVQMWLYSRTCISISVRDHRLGASRPLQPSPTMPPRPWSRDSRILDE
ncbi:hypothetical protein VUR80DRAFT_9987 [Thermomyces stellatus]